MRDSKVSPVLNQLSGALAARDGDGMAISESQVTQNERRMTRARKEIEAKIAAKLSRSPNRPSRKAPKPIETAGGWP
jgi:hypothetical protein